MKNFLKTLADALSSNDVTIKNVSNSKITVNGVEYPANGKNIQTKSINGVTTVKVNGQVITSVESNTVIIKFEGDLANIDCTNLTVTGDVHGDVDGTNITINGNVTGDVDGTNIRCRDIKGDVDATQITCNNNTGNINL